MALEWRYSYRCKETLGLKWTPWQIRPDELTLYQLREIATEEVGSPEDVYSVQSKPADEVTP